MTNEEKLASKPHCYIFHRAIGWYPVTIPEATLDDNIKANPGTLVVTDAASRATIWTAEDGYLQEPSCKQ